MAFIDQFKLAYKVMFRPNKTTSTYRPIGDMLKFYYNILLIPLIVFIILEVGFYFMGISTFGTPIALVTIVAIVLIGMLVLNLLGFFIRAVIVHLFGMALGQFKKSFDNTLTGIIYGVVPVTLFIWVLAIPNWGKYLFALFSLWGLVITIIAIANQQKVSKMAVLGIFIAIIIVVVVIAIIVGYFVFSHFTGLGSGLLSLVGGSLMNKHTSQCVSFNASYSCRNVTFTSDGKMSGVVVQQVKYNVSKLWVGCLLDLGNTTNVNPIMNQLNISGYNSGVVLNSTFSYGQAIPISGLQCYNAATGTAITSLQSGTQVSGLLTLHYTQQKTNTTRLVYAVIVNYVN